MSMEFTLVVINIFILILIKLIFIFNIYINNDNDLKVTSRKKNSILKWLKKIKMRKRLYIIEAEYFYKTHYHIIIFTYKHVFDT